jgi:hypothetical protein
MYTAARSKPICSIRRFPLFWAKVGGSGLSSASKHSAKVVCYKGSVWISARQFWGLVRDDTIEYLSERPLTGKFKGQPADFLLTINHTILNLTCPEHRQAVLHSRRYAKR